MKRSITLSAMRMICVLLLIAFNVRSQIPSLKWARSFTGQDPKMSYAVAVDASGNVYTTGFYDAATDFDPGPTTYDLTCAGIADVFVSKLDSMGNFIWAKGMGGPGPDYGSSIVIDLQGNVLVTGVYSDSFSDFDPDTGVVELDWMGVDDIFVLKLNSNGDLIWAKGIGGPQVDIGAGITVDGQNNVYVTGSFYGSVDFDPGLGTFSLTADGDLDACVFKLDAAGNFVWASAMGGPDYNFGQAIDLDQNGNVYTTGIYYGTVDFDPGVATYSITSAGEYDIYVSKLNATGNFVWAKSVGGPDDDIATSIAVDPAGYVYAAGSFSGTSDFDPGIGVTNLSSTGDLDVFLMKLTSSTGNYSSARSMGGIMADYCNSLALDFLGNVFLTGTFAGQSDFDPSPATMTMGAMGTNDAYVLKINAAGNFDWARQMGGVSGSAEGMGIIVDGTGNIISTGYFDGTVDFDPGTGISNISAHPANYDVYVHKLGKLPNSVSLQEWKNEFKGNTIYPNPGQGVFNFELAETGSFPNIEIYDVAGRLVKKQTALMGLNSFDLTDAKPGIYFVNFLEGGRIVGVEKVVFTVRE